MSKQVHKQSKIGNKIKYSSEGITASFLSDTSVRWSYYFSIPVSITFFVLSPDLTSKLLSLFIFLMWIVFENLNTALEATVDRIGTKYHKLSKIAKDVMAGVVSLVVVFMLISIVILSFNIKYGYDNWKDENENRNFSGYIYDSFRK